MNLNYPTKKFRGPPAIARYVGAAFVLLTLAYLWVRIPLWNPATPILSSLLLLAEAFGLFTITTHALTTWHVLDRTPAPPLVDMTADLFITTWNEPIEMLRNTLLAAKSVRRVRTVWLLDDGDRAEARALADELQVRYLTRQDRSHAKAGNLNNALAHCDAEFVAQFDCDHAPCVDFLDKTLGYFRDEKIAFVQTPQDFFNTDSYQHRTSIRDGQVWHEQTLFYDSIQKGKDRWNAAFFCGSNAIVRTAAMRDIGGFATGTITEDIHTSLRLHKGGWSSAFHSESLAFGVSPMDAQQYLLQRLRWARGAMQVWSRESILTSKQLTFMQKLCYLTSIVTYFEGWQTLIIFLLPIVSLLTGWLPLTVGGTSFLVIFTLWFATGVWLNELLGRGSAKTFWMLDFQFVRCFMFARATLALIIKRQWTFAVTPKSKKDSAPNTNQLPGVPVAMTILAVASLPIGIALYMYTAHLTLTALILNLFWTSVNIVIAVRALSRVRSFSVERRDSYRFQIPVPLTLLVTSEKSFLCSAIDLSRDGARIEVPTGLLMPDKIEGVLHLPSADVPFSGVVRRLKPSADRSVNYVSIQFEWPDQKSADPVSYLLFGNPAQWELYRTPEERAHIVTTGHVDPHRFKRWHPARMVVEGAPDHFCLIEQQRGGHDVLRVLTYAKPAQDIGVMHLKPLHSEQRSANMFISETHHVPLNYGNIYVMFVVPDRRISRESNLSRPAALKGTLR